MMCKKYMCMFTTVVVDVSVTESKLFVQTRQKAIMVTQLTATAIPSPSSSAAALLPSFFQSICQNQSQKTKKVDQEKTSHSIYFVRTNGLTTYGDGVYTQCA